MEPTHPDRLVENVTAPSAGGFPGPDGEVRLRMRLPFRTGSCFAIDLFGRPIPRCAESSAKSCRPRQNPWAFSRGHMGSESFLSAKQLKIAWV
ncbi:MAG: hypothetical protein ACOX52_15570 [Verrucomicrobiota bacterium]